MNNKTPDFYLTSSEGHIIGEPRMCFVLRRIQYGLRKDCLLVYIDPVIDERRYGLGTKEIDEIVLATRFKGDTLIPPSRWPLDVYVLRFLTDNIHQREVFENAELSNMAWGEIYKSINDIPSGRND